MPLAAAVTSEFTRHEINKVLSYRTNLGPPILVLCKVSRTSTPHSVMHLLIFVWEEKHEQCYRFSEALVSWLSLRTGLPASVLHQHNITVSLYWKVKGHAIGQADADCGSDLFSVLSCCRKNFDHSGGMWGKVRSSREGFPPNINHQLSDSPQELSGRRLEDHLCESGTCHSRVLVECVHGQPSLDRAGRSVAALLSPG